MSKDRRNRIFNKVDELKKEGKLVGFVAEDESDLSPINLQKYHICRNIFWVWRYYRMSYFEFSEKYNLNLSLLDKTLHQKYDELDIEKMEDFQNLVYSIKDLKEGIELAKRYAAEASINIKIRKAAEKEIEDLKAKDMWVDSVMMNTSELNEEEKLKYHASKKILKHWEKSGLTVADFADSVGVEREKVLDIMETYISSFTKEEAYNILNKIPKGLK